MANAWKELFEAVTELGEGILDALGGEEKAKAPPRPPQTRVKPAVPTADGYVVSARQHEMLRSTLESMNRSVDRQKNRLQEALKRYHGNGLLPTHPLPLDQVVDAAVRTLDSSERVGRTLPDHIAGTPERTVEALKVQIADLESQQAADVKALASQARELEVQREVNRKVYDMGVLATKLQGQGRVDPHTGAIYHLKSVYKHGKVWNVTIFCPEPESRLTLSIGAWMTWDEAKS